LWLEKETRKAARFFPKHSNRFRQKWKHPDAPEKFYGIHSRSIQIHEPGWVGTLGLQTVGTGLSLPGPGCFFVFRLFKTNQPSAADRGAEKI
jgi:hypothetical protein